MTKPRTILALAATAAVAVPAAGFAQDPGPAPNPDAAPLKATLSAPSSVTKAALKKGITATVGCDAACDARVQLAGPIGIVGSKSGPVTAGGTKRLKIKPAAFQIKEMKAGQTYTLSLQARTADGGVGQAQKKVKIK